MTDPSSNGSPPSDSSDSDSDSGNGDNESESEKSPDVGFDPESDPNAPDPDAPEPLQKLSGYSEVRKIREFIFECPECGEEITTLVNNECENCGYVFDVPQKHSSTRVVYQTDCQNCGFGISIVEDNRTEFNGYLCYNCGNIVAVRFRNTFYQPIDLLEKQEEGVTVADTDHKRVVAKMLEFQANSDQEHKSESDENNESELEQESDRQNTTSYSDSANVLLCHDKDAYCGFLIWEGNTAKRIWIDKGFEAHQLVSDLVEHWCDELVEEEDIVIESSGEELEEILEEITEDGRVFGKKIEVTE